MKQFEYYEFIAVLIPGVILLYGLSLVFKEVTLVFGQNISLGGFGLFFIISFAVGHLLQAFGNIFESVYWRFNSGMPTDWIRSGKGSLFDEATREELGKRIQQHFKLKDFNFDEVSCGEWNSIVRQIYIQVEKQEQNRRVDIFNSYYGLFRGMSVSFFILSICILIKSVHLWPWVIFCLALLAVSMFRMHRFSRYYAKELFLQFIQLKFV